MKRFVFPALLLLAIALARPARAGLVLTLEPGAGTDLSNLAIHQAFDLQVFLSGLTSEKMAYIVLSISSDSSLLDLAGSTAGPVVPIGLGTEGGAILLTSQQDATTVFFGAYGNYNPGPYMTTNGLLGTLHLKALAAGSGTFAMSGLGDLEVNSLGSVPIDISSSLDYRILGGSPTGVPEPSIPVLLGTALCALLACRRRFGKFAGKA